MAPVAIHVTVDIVVLTVRDDALQALLIRRGEEPFKGYLALPGGFVEPEEDVDSAARRELREETGVEIELVHLEQVGTYGAPHRDPRARMISVAYLAVMPDLPDPQAGSDAASAEWIPVGDIDISDLAFDHEQILSDSIERARSKLEYSPLATAFCRDTFSIADLRHVYEIVWGRPLDPANFHRKVTGAGDFIRPTHQMSSGGLGRPAKLFGRAGARVLHPPILR